MPNNLIVGNNAALSRPDIEPITFEASGLTTTNATGITEIGAPNKSWRPERNINAVSGFQPSKGYLIVMKQALDLENTIITPLNIPNGGGGGGGTVNPVYSNDNFTDTNGTALGAHTSETGPLFNEFDGTWEIQSNKAVNTGSVPASTEWVALKPLAGKSDVKITIVASLLNSALLQVWLRATGLAGSYNASLLLLAHADDVAGQDYALTMYNIVSGVPTVITGVNNVSAATDITPGTDFTVIITLIGTSLTINMNGVDYVTAITIPTQAGIKFGFGGAGAAADLRINSFKVEDPTP